MVYYKNGCWHLCAEKVRYVQHGKEIKQYVGQEGHQWWVDFEQKWEHTEIQEFIPVEPTSGQVERLEEIKQLNLPDGFGSVLGEYVEHGVFPEGYMHVLRPIQIAKEQTDQDMYLIDQDFRLSLVEMGV